jgi:hypothetical protein
MSGGEAAEKFENRPLGPTNSFQALTTKSGVSTRARERKGKKYLIFMPFGVIELSRMCLKEFSSGS